MQRIHLVVPIVLVIVILSLFTRHAYIDSRHVKPKPVPNWCALPANEQPPGVNFFMDCIPDAEPAANRAIAHEQDLLAIVIAVMAFILTGYGAAIAWKRARSRVPNWHVGQIVIVWICSLGLAGAAFASTAVMFENMGNRLTAPYFGFAGGIGTAALLSALFFPLMTSWRWFGARGQR